MCASRVKTPTRRAPAKLARGRHPLTQQAVVDSQRARLIDALPRVVASKGYAAATVADVIALAGVSRRTFYELFPGLEDCFLAAYEHGMRQLFEAIRQAVAPLPRNDWRSRTCAAVRAYFEALATMPDATRAYSIEVMGAGERALQARAWVVDQWLAQWRALDALRRESEPGTPPLDDAQLLALIGGLEELVRHCVQHGGAPALPGMADAACRFALAVLQADAAAATGFKHR